MKVRKICAGGLMLFGLTVNASAMVKIDITPDKAEAVYNCGEKAVFAVKVTDENGALLNDGDIEISFAAEFAPPYSQLTRTLAVANPAHVTETMVEPGFLRCIATFTKGDTKITKHAVVGFSPEKIITTQEYPADFNQFWAKGLESARKIPFDAKLERLDRLSTDSFNGYKISIANINNTRMYGYLSIPTAPGKYPILYTVPGAGAGYNGIPEDFDRSKVITMALNVHDFEVEPATANAKYEELNKNGMYMVRNVENPNSYYFRRTILGLCRGLDYLQTLPQWDGKHLAVWGSSQGGAMTIAVTGLNPDKVTAAAVNVPAMCDFAASGRNGSPGWPLSSYPQLAKDASAMNTLSYYDGVNFAKNIQCPMIFAVGFVDTTCPSGAIYAAYNAIGTNKKAIWNSPKMAHDFDPECSKYRKEWILGALGLSEPLDPK